MWDWQPGQTYKCWYETCCPKWAGVWPVYLCPDTSRAVPAWTVLELTSVKLPTMTRQMATMKGRGPCFHIWDLSMTFSAWLQTRASRAWTFWDLYDVFGPWAMCDGSLVASCSHITLRWLSPQPVDQLKGVWSLWYQRWKYSESHIPGWVLH